jgi:hypothetical protein
MARETEKATQQMRDAFSGLQTGVALASGALLALGGAGAALIGSSTLLAARVETLGAVMKTVGANAGYSADAMDRFEQAVRDQGITTQVARTSIIRLVQAEVDLARASDLARIAQDAAVIAGINSSEAFERMVWGIQTLNPRILKTMGLTINLQSAYKKLADNLGITVNELTMTQKKQVAVNAVMEAGKNISGAYASAMETAGKKLTSLPRHLEEARLAIGERFTEAFAWAIDAITDLLKWFNALEPSTKDTISAFLLAGSAVTIMAGGLGLASIALLKLLPLMMNAGAAINILKGVGGVGAMLKGMASGGEFAAVAMTALTGTSYTAAAATTALKTALLGLGVITGVIAIVGGLITAYMKLKKAKEEAFQAQAEEEKRIHTISASYDDYIARMKLMAEEEEVVLTLHGERIYVSEKLEENMSRMSGAAQANLVISQQLSDTYEVMSPFVYSIAKETGLWGDELDAHMAKLRAHTGGLRSLWDEIEGGPDAISPTVETMETAAEAAERMEREFKTAMTGLQYVLGVDVSQAMEDHDERVIELQETYQDAQSELDAMTEKYERWYGSIDRMRDISPARAEQYDELVAKVDDAQAAIDRESEAWDRNTKQIMFNMAQRALELGLHAAVEEGSITAAEAAQTQFEATSDLASAFGLIDPTTAQMWDDMGAAVAGLITDPEDVAGFTQAVNTIGENVGLLPESVDPGVAALQRFRDELEGMPENFRRLYEFEMTSSGVIPEQTGAGGGGGGGTGGGQPPDIARQGGGYWSGREAVAVGEAGEEWIYPTRDGYVVLPAGTVNRLKGMGLRAGSGLQGGGMFGDRPGAQGPMVRHGDRTVTMSEGAVQLQVGGGRMGIETQIQVEDMFLKVLEDLL